ncbi:MAG: hypothetical protein RLZZ299_2504 [Pseudomonadota bacterium]|jgi:hypothetical protein
MITPLLALALVAHAGSRDASPGAEGGTPSATPPPTAPAATALDPRSALGRALAARDPMPCAALPDSDAATLLAWADAEVGPPWASMRAATCLTERFPEDAARAAIAWTADPGRQGLVLAVLDVSRALPEDAEVRLARAALAAPHLRARAIRALRTSPHPDVRVLAEQAAAE